MNIVAGKLIARIKRTPSVESFRFTVAEPIDFLPGQFVQVIFDPGQPQNKELNKYLSFSASPRRPYIEVTKRLSDSAFSRKLAALKTGDKIMLRGPLGTCVFSDAMLRVGFLIGGIGITPVASILEYITDRRINIDANLLYSNRTDEEIAFKPELDRFSQIQPSIKINYTVTECQPKDKACAYGRIDEKFVRARMADAAERVCFIFGPPVMVVAMRKLCLDLECQKENIRAESFAGY